MAKSDSSPTKSVILSNIAEAAELSRKPLDQLATVIPSRNPYFQLPFLICVGVLIVSAIGIKMVMHWAHDQRIKLPIPLQKPLVQLDITLLAPYKVIQQDTLPNYSLDALGTDDYLQWILEDPEVPTDSPVRYCHLFITYFTGEPKAPHVPDSEYVGNAYIQKDAQTLRLRLQDPASPDAPVLPTELSVRQLVFASNKTNFRDPQTEFSVLSIFKANDQYADSRTSVRAIMSNNFWGKYSYFSKVEWKFSATLDFLPTGQPPTDNEIIQASEKLMRVILPQLETQHWPDWEKAKQDSVSKP
jgi:hypothetical protein